MRLNCILTTLILLSTLFISCKPFKSGQANYFDYTKVKLKDSLLYYHIKKLDSTVSMHPHRKEYACCPESIGYLEVKTGIQASTSGTTLGRLSFKKQDWANWHKWIKKNYD